MESLEVLCRDILLLSNLTCYLGDENIIQQREMLLRANSLLFRDILPKVLTECLQTLEQSLGEMDFIKGRVFSSKALRQTQIIFYRLEDNSLTKIKSYKWLFIYKGYYFVPGHDFPLSPNLFQRTCWFLSIEWKCRVVFANITVLPLQQTTEKKPGFFILLSRCKLFLWHNGWHSCPLFCVFKSYTFSNLLGTT